ncbi:MAG TPA: hypothetical protein VJY40_06335, partial [Corynebacterium sp.]|nr:hypothetical protein [Corynebacterium sp.]
MMPDPLPAGTKRCLNCGEEKPLAAFHRDRSSPDGHKRWCKACANAASREYYGRGPLPPPPPKWVSLRCEVCGGEMRYRRSEIEGRQRRGMPLPRF